MDGDKIDYGVLRDSIGYQLRLAEIATMQTFARAFEGSGVTPARFTALELIARNPGIRPARLARAMAIETSNLATLLRHLEQQGWITHGAAEDRRGKVLATTPAGERHIVALRQLLTTQNAMLAAGLTAQERATLSALLGKLLARVAFEPPQRLSPPPGPSWDR